LQSMLLYVESRYSIVVPKQSGKISAGLIIRATTPPRGATAAPGSVV
jgi:hypothetical protein